MEPLLRTVVAIALEVMLNFLLEVLDVDPEKKILFGKVAMTTTIDSDINFTTTVLK